MTNERPNFDRDSFWKGTLPFLASEGDKPKPAVDETNDFGQYRLVRVEGPTGTTGLKAQFLNANGVFKGYVFGARNHIRARDYYLTRMYVDATPRDGVFAKAIEQPVLELGDRNTVYLPLSRVQELTGLTGVEMEHDISDVTDKDLQKIVLEILLQGREEFQHAYDDLSAKDSQSDDHRRMQEEVGRVEKGFYTPNSPNGRIYTLLKGAVAANGDGKNEFTFILRPKGN